MKSIYEEDVPTNLYISLINRKHAAYLNKKLEKENLSFGLYPLLIKVHIEDGISQEDLATFFQLNESTITRNLKKLEEKGFIKKNLEHRKKIITTTPMGSKTAQKIMNYDEQWDEQIRKNMTEEEFQSSRKHCIKYVYL